MQGWSITSRRKQTTRIETRRQKPPLQSLFFFFRSQQKIGFLCAKMKAGTVVLFTLFLPVLAGPPVEAAESDGRRIWYRVYHWYRAARAANYCECDSGLGSRFSYNPPICPCEVQHYILPMNEKLKEFESTYNIKIEDLLKIGELKQEHDHLTAEEFKDFIKSNFEEFKDFIGNFIDNEFELFLKNYTQKAKETVKAMKAMKEMALALDSLDSSMDFLQSTMESLESLESSMASMASKESSIAVESTKRQRSIIFGLTTLTIFSGLALLLFWILEEQKKKSRANIKA